MKQTIYLLACVPIVAHAAAPSTTCPSGYVEITSQHITIATTCPSGTVSVGTADSCLVSNPSGDCIMYAPVEMSFSDDSGTYEYTEPCPLT